jgi:hypothetical protein
MHLHILPARAGYLWFREGIGLFLRRPFNFLSIFLTYILAIMLLSFIPGLGLLLSLVFMPTVSACFMALGREAMFDRAVSLQVVVQHFRQCGSKTIKILLEAGLLYATVICLIFVLSALADGGWLVHLMVGQPDHLPSDSLIQRHVKQAVGLAILCYFPVLMAFWFTPALIMWHNMALSKALFFSIVACWRNRKAFLVYGLLWVGFGMLVSLISATLFIKASPFAAALLIFCSAALTTIFHCASYVTYRGCFNNEEQA